MSNLILLGMLAASVAGADGTHLHRATIEHRGAPVTIDYRAKTALTTRQIGMSPPTRMGVARCNWVAKVSVERHMKRTGTASASRVVDNELELKGSRPGTCTAARKAIRAEVAARDDEVRRHMLAVAERDRKTLLAELEASGSHPGAGAH